MEYYPEIYQVIPTEDYRVYLYFDDGRIKLYDASELVTKGLFRQLAENNLFFDACTVLNNTLAWTPDMSYDPATCLDLDPIVLYEECPTVDEPSWLFKNIPE
ncbi:MAG: DUF2442 domain-containing protein [Clostridiales bacterium]|jgi:hypothetical protein|nr:DUF2442 domain-containing protein [Clostridiales bacterium]